MSHRFLMCSPEYFDVSYVINPWMADNVHRVGRTQANAQWSILHRLIQNAAAEVQLIDPQPDLPDMPFTANAGLVVGKRAILSNFKFAERRNEEKHFERWFSDQCFDVQRVPGAIPFEGAGDALLDRSRRCVWMGYGHRTVREAGPQLQKLLDLEVISLELIDPRFYHLDTCFCPLPRGYVMYYPSAFSEASRATLRSRISPEQAIIVEEADAIEFACNAVNIGDRVFLNAASYPLLRALTQAGFYAVLCSLSEFLRAGGASKCLTLRLEDAV